MESPIIIDKKPVAFQVESAKAYAWCACGKSEKEGGLLCDGKHKGGEFKSVHFKAEESKTVYLCQCKHTKNAPYCDGSHASL